MLGKGEDREMMAQAKELAAESKAYMEKVREEAIKSADPGELWDQLRIARIALQRIAALPCESSGQDERRPCDSMECPA